MKMPWAKGRKSNLSMVRLDNETHALAKEAAYAEKMTLGAWLTRLVKIALKVREVEK